MVQNGPTKGKAYAGPYCSYWVLLKKKNISLSAKRPDLIRLQALQELSLQTTLTQSTTETSHARSPSPNRRHSNSPNRHGVLRQIDPDERPLPALHRQHRTTSHSSATVSKPTEPDADDQTLSDQVSIMSVDPSFGLDRPFPVTAVGASGQVLAPIEDEETEALELEEWEEDEQQNTDQQFESRPSVPAYPLTGGQHPNQPEPLSESNRRLASVAIDAVGLDLVCF